MFKNRGARPGMLKKVGIVALTLLALEIVARAYLLSSIPSDCRPPLRELVGQFFLGGSYVGEFRGKKVLFKKPAGVYRILALGGSTTAGIASDEETWPFKLEQKLNASAPAGRKYEVINLGQTGAVSAHEYFFLRTHAYLDPDLVIVYDGYNDLVVSNAQSAYYLASSKKSYEMLEERFGVAHVLSFLYRNFALANRVDVYLYRLKNSLNRAILKNKWFGLGRQTRTRAFENVEWYASQNFIGPEFERLRSLKRADAEAAAATAALTEAETAAVRGIFEDGEKTLSLDEFLRALSASGLAEPARDRLLTAIGIPETKIELAGLEMSYSLLELTGRDKDADLFPEIYALSLGNIAGFLKAREIPGLFIFQPFLSEKIVRLKHGLSPEDLAGLSNFTTEEDAHFVLHNAARKDIMRRAAEAHGTEFLDLQNVFDGVDHREVYLDNCHNTGRGLDLLADAISAHLRGGRLP